MNKILNFFSAMYSDITEYSLPTILISIVSCIIYLLALGYASILLWALLGVKANIFHVVVGNIILDKFCYKVIDGIGIYLIKTWDNS